MTRFDASDWLDRFEAAGGGWIVRDGKPSFMMMEGAPVAAIVAELYVPGRHDAVETVILGRDATKEMQSG